MTIRKSRGASTSGGRVRRRPPARTEPIRDWPGAFRRPDSWNASNHLAPQTDALKTAARPQDANTGDGIKLGYGVIEKHMRRARAVADKYTAGPRRSPRTKPTDEVQDTVARVFRSLSDLVPLLGTLANTISVEGLTRGLTGNIANEKKPSPTGFVEASSRVIVEIRSERPANVAVDLLIDAERRPLKTSGLIDARTKGAPLTAVTFAPSARNQRATLRIRVPSKQSPGVYSGLLTDPASGEPQGVVTVRITR